MKDASEFTFGLIKKQDVIDALTKHCGEYVRVMPIMDTLLSDFSIECVSGSEVAEDARSREEYQKRQVELSVRATEIAQGAVAKFRKALGK